MNIETLRAPERETLGALAGLGAGRGQIGASLAVLKEWTGYGNAPLIKAIRNLEDGKYVEAERPKALARETRFVLTEKGAAYVRTKGWHPEPFPDCFRARDLKAAGRLWRAVDKDTPLTYQDISEATGLTNKTGIRRHIETLSSLAISAVTIARDGQLKLFTFHELDADDRAAIAASIDTRAEGYRIITRAETEARNGRERNSFWLRLRNREQGYDVALPDMLAQTIETEHGCLLYTGELDRDGYAKVPGSRLPFGTGHRASYRVLVGPIPEGHQVHHVCNLPACIAPGHLIAVTKEQHDFYTEHHGPKSEQALQSVVECRVHGTRIALGNPAPPLELFPCLGECGDAGLLELVTLLAPKCPSTTTQESHELAA